MSYYKHHVFFCCNQRDEGRACCNDLRQQGTAPDRVNWGASGRGRVTLVGD